MKSKFLITLFCCVFIYSCGDIGGSYPPPTLPTCTWTSQEDIAVTPINLRAPSGMSSFFNGIVPSNNTFTTLLAPLAKGDYWPNSNKARIYGELVVDGSTCDSDVFRPYDYKAGDSRIGGNFLRMFVPSQGFYGLVKMTIRSDDFRTSSNNIAEYVWWTGSSTNPNYPSVYGSVTGIRKTYNTTTGAVIVSSSNGCAYFNDGSRNCF